MFRDRPLTWLFVIATLLVDAGLIFNGNVDAYRGWIIGFFLGQSAVLGCWFAVGSRHRLERGALFVVGQIVVALIVWFCVSDGSPDQWGRVLAALAIYGAASASSAFLAKLCFSRFQITQAKKQADILRYPLMEIFGWTVVVAIASAIMRQATFTHLFQDRSDLSNLLGSAAIIGLWATFFANAQQASRYAVFVGASVTGIFFLVAYNIATFPSLVISLLVSMAYAALWIFVRRLDAPSTARTAPQTVTDDQTSPPRPLGPRASARPDPQS